MKNYIKETLNTCICVFSLLLSVALPAQEDQGFLLRHSFVQAGTNASDSELVNGVRVFLGGNHDSGGLVAPDVESASSLGNSRAVGKANLNTATVSGEITGSVSLSAHGKLRDTLYFINESADWSTEVKIPYEVEWSSSGDRVSDFGGRVASRPYVSFPVSKLRVTPDTSQVSFDGDDYSDVHKGTLTLRGITGMMQIEMAADVYSIDKPDNNSWFSKGRLVFRFPEGIPDGVAFDSISGSFLNKNTDKRVWGGKYGGVFDQLSPFEQGGLFNSIKNWIPAHIPSEDNHVLFLPDPYATSEGLINPVTMPSTSVTVDSVTVDANNVKLLFPEPSMGTSIFTIKDEFKLVDGSLELSAISRSELFDTYGILQLLGDTDMSNGELVLGNRTAVSGPSWELEPGYRFVLKGEGTHSTNEQLATIEDSMRLLPWTKAEPVDENGQPQLEVKGQGRVSGDLINEGWLELNEPPMEIDASHDSRLVVEGDYTQTDTGVLEVNLGGVVNLGDVDGFQGLATPLTIKGKAVIDGTLRLSRKEGYVAKPGDYFTIVLAEKGIDLGGGLRNDGGPKSPTIYQRGFKKVEGILETGNPNVYWGIDYNQRKTGEHIIQVVALSVPRRVIRTYKNFSRLLAAEYEFLTPAAIQNRKAAANLIITSHGTSHFADLNGSDALGEVSIGMHALAEKGGLGSEYDVIAIDWRQFATNPLGGSEPLLFHPLPECLGSSFAVRVRSFLPNKGSDSRSRSFDPYEAARFSQQYSRSLLSYFKETGYNIGGLQSLQTIGHSSGSYMADGILDVLNEPGISPFAGDQPAKTHLTLLDAYLPPAKGGTDCLLASWKGEPLGELGNAAFGSASYQIEHYFNTDISGGTNNEIDLRPSSAVVTFDVTDYLLEPIYWAGGHGVPVEFYRDSIYAHLNESLLLNVAQTPTQSYLLALPRIAAGMSKVIKGAGAVFSPLFVDLGLGVNLDSTYLNASADDLSDGDIDVFVPELTKIVKALAKWGSSQVDVKAFETLGTNVTKLGIAAYRFITSSPAASKFELQIDKQFNLLVFDVERVSGIGGNITVIVEGLTVGFIDFNLEPNLHKSGSLVPYKFSTPAMSGDTVTVEFVVNDTDEGQVVMDLSNIGFAILENIVTDEVGGSDGSIVSSPGATSESSGGGGSLSTFLIFLLLLMYLGLMYSRADNSGVSHNLRIKR